MGGAIGVRKVSAEGTVIKYEIYDNTGLDLLKKDRVEASVRFFNTEEFDFRLGSLPQSILAIPITLYLLPITYFYNVELLLPCIDKELYERLPVIYSAYSKIYGPFKPGWRGRVCPGRIEQNSLPQGDYEKIVFFSGGVDACHAGINNPGEKSVLVSVPSIEWLAKNEGALRREKFNLIAGFSKIINSKWALVSNDFNGCIFKDVKIQEALADKLSSAAFQFDGWVGTKYLGNMCSVAPFAWAMGVKTFVMGSAFEQEKENYAVNYDGANPDLSDSMRFAGIGFSEQDGLRTRRSEKVRNIISWCKKRDTKIKLWACFDDKPYQCGTCVKCVRTQLNILCAGENPRDWGFERFCEKRFSHFVGSFKYYEGNACWLWDIVDSIDDAAVYPYCDRTLHWLKGFGYEAYLKKAGRLRKIRLVVYRIFKIHRYPHYIKVVCRRLNGRRV